MAKIIRTGGVEEMNILSLFDGMSCGRVALDRAGIKVDNYYSSEIDKYAIQIADKNYPQDTCNRLGDVTNWKEWELPKIDLLIGGSPCQGFSFAGKQLNFDDPRSKLFFEFVDILKAYKPKYFLLENVKMKKEYQDVISGYLGVEPIEINSALVSAQNRKRLYWTNIPNVTQPEDKGIMLKDIILEAGAFGVTYNRKDKIKSLYLEKAHCISASDWRGLNRNQNQPAIFETIKEYIIPFDKALKIMEGECKKGKICEFGNGGQGNGGQGNRVYSIHGKSVTLCGLGGGRGAKTGLYLFGNITPNEQELISYENNEVKIRQATKKGYDIANDCDSINFSCPNSNTRRGRVGKGKANTLDTQCNQGVCIKEEPYLFGCITPDRINKRQDGQRFNDGKKFYTLTAQDKHGILVEGYIRKLTPVECERLQTMPDNYTAGVSNSQRYKMLGNGWTADVISHILSFMPN